MGPLNWIQILVSYPEFMAYESSSTKVESFAAWQIIIFLNKVIKATCIINVKEIAHIFLQ